MVSRQFRVLETVGSSPAASTIFSGFNRKKDRKASNLCGLYFFVERRPIMKRTISNPNKVSKKMYLGIMCISLITLLLSLVIPTCDLEFLKALLDVIKNLSYGSIASTIVALLIDIANTKKANKRSHEIYDLIYADIKVNLAWFIDTWAQICSVSFKDKDYSNEKHSWTEWYQIAKNNYDASTPERQKQLLYFFHKSILDSTKYVNRAIEKITSQSYMLIINEAMNLELRSVISDFEFEFNALKTDLSYEEYEEHFWDHIETINKDLVNYIGAWKDISFYNTLKFKPFNVLDAAKYEFAKEE